MPTIAEPRLNQPCWFDLSTTDLPAAMAFYGELFGWTFHDGGEALGHYTQAHRDGRAAAGLVPKMPGMEETPTTWTVYVGVMDAEAIASRIVAQGGSMMVPPMDVMGLGAMAVAVDPEGAVFGLWQPGTFIGAQVEGEPGAMCWAEVNTRQPAEAVTFYGGVFGLAAHRMENADREYHTLHLSSGDAVAGVFGMTSDMAHIPPHWMPYFVVESIAHAQAVMARHGATVLYGPEPTPHGDMLLLRDAQGGFCAVLAAENGEGTTERRPQ
jgi:predicted enzyme related to lactoylglutathione lyase